MPFAPDDSDGPKGVDFTRINKPLNEPGWQRSFACFNEVGHIIAHVHLKGEILKALSHRCWLELGVEKTYRRQGMGLALCKEAIRYARETALLDWIDLYTFAHNTPARTLYKKLGFREVGIAIDKFRLGELSIDDVQMTLSLRNRPMP
jgi:ribosomal protein S18 acetylase RimI-like enzyme